jgi:hypothetical protein
MVIRGNLTCQYHVPLNSSDLDSALRRMFPYIPDDARRFLRHPLRRWHVAAVKYLSSQQDRFDDLVLTDAQLRIFISCPSNRRGWVAAMFGGLRREVDAALVLLAADCPRRYSCALIQALETLFPKSGGIGQPSELLR